MASAYTIPTILPKPSDRNLEIYHRHADGEMPVHLSAEFGISRTRIHQIVNQVRDYLNEED
jgi:Mor family transcriptional regulator